MSKGVKRSIIITIVVVIIFAVLYVVYDNLKTTPVNTNEEGKSNIDNTNTGLENIINDLFENVTNVEENNNQDNSENTKNEEPTEILNGTVSSKEKKAVELVKKDWGNSKGIYFSNMGIDSSGRYIVAVCDSSTTKTLAFYKVDVVNEIATKQ